MGRPCRLDPPGGWHHVWGRGIAKRPIFETRSDIRRFQAALARAVRRGDIEVHSFTFLTTHFHLLVRSPRGKLSTALGRVLWDFTHYFNRKRGRDGTVWRGRFRSKPVTSLGYRRILVRYIDANPVQARLAAVPWKYEHGSAQRFLFRTPRWLARSWIDEEIRGRTGKTPQEGGRYENAFPLAGESAMALALARQEAPVTGPDPLDDLLEAAPDVVRARLESRARLADASRPGTPIVDSPTVATLLRDLAHRRPNWRVSPSSRQVPAFKIAAVALLRELCGQTYVTIARRLHISPTHAKTLFVQHLQLTTADPDYAREIVNLVCRGLETMRRECGGSCLARK